MSPGEQAAAETSGAAGQSGAGRGGGARPLSGAMIQALRVNKKLQQYRRSGQTLPQQPNYTLNISITDADESLSERESEGQSEVSFSSYKIIC